ncbi:hypothetical protein AAFF_G00266750 [Aldrovandia affinis]|uniref:UDENN domain-containing protein n=1 Tax=Aldrovandia affinis TaxID=143900 RepID=A0AAD7W2X8_9TELE|nr:hypothetical protein AAFF_G00266750 [Aldrovandia affinis]
MVLATVVEWGLVVGGRLLGAMFVVWDSACPNRAGGPAPSPVITHGYCHCTGSDVNPSIPPNIRRANDRRTLRVSAFICDTFLRFRCDGHFVESHATHTAAAAAATHSNRKNQRTREERQERRSPDADGLHRTRVPCCLFERLIGGEPRTKDPDDADRQTANCLTEKGVELIYRPSADEDGFPPKRGAKSFSSMRSDPRGCEKREQTEARGSGLTLLPVGGGPAPPRVTPLHKPMGKGAWNRVRPCPARKRRRGGEEGHFPRLSSFLSSLRSLPKLYRDRGAKEPTTPPPDSAPREAPPREPRYMSGQFFFEYLVVVSLKKKKDGVYEPQITYQFPKRDGMVKFQKEEEEKTLKAITLFCFPRESTGPSDRVPHETFSFVLTEVDASRRNGYCRRLLPHGNGARPPEAYCIISKLACFGLFSKIFDEVEKRRQISMAMIYPFMQSLREAPFPAPGHTVTIKSFIPESGTEMISLTRPLDSWLEHVDFRTLFRCLQDDEVLQVFASTIMERRIVFIAEELGTLSQVINAVAALLYPFTWQHTFIPIVPEILIDVVMAPTPYLLGVQRRLMECVTDQSDLSDVLVVDLSEGVKQSLIIRMGDEKSILPQKLQDEILLALRARKDNSTLEDLNRVVSEAFLPFFVKTVGHFAPYVKRTEGQPGCSRPGASTRPSSPRALGTL